VKIFLGAILLSIVLGIAIDLVTANIAVDYFAVYHPHVIDSRSPWLLALVWGVIASWWAGAAGGAILAFFNRNLPTRVPSRMVLTWMAKACGIIWCTMMAIVAGVYLLASAIPLNQRRLTFEEDRRLMAVAIAHSGEYVFAAIAVLIIAVKMHRYSRRQAN